MKGAIGPCTTPGREGFSHPNAIHLRGREGGGANSFATPFFMSFTACQQRQTRVTRVRRFAKQLAQRSNAHGQHAQQAPP
eukprot:9481747-Pyramimonas_sp.AAC.1